MIGRSAVIGVVICMLTCFLIPPPSHGDEQRDIATVPTGKAYGKEYYQNLWALVIGVERYQNSSYNLKYSDDDAQKVKDLLTQLGIPGDNITLLLSEQATAKKIREAIDDLTKKVGPKDGVIIYFAGHGKDAVGSDGSKLGFIVPYDGDLSKLVSTCIGMDEIRRWISLIKANHVLVLMSCCHSGLAGMARALPQGTPPEVRQLLSWPSRLLITAGGSGEPDLELEHLQSSPFTYSLVEAVKNATADANKDGYVIVDELYASLITKVTARSDGRQHPKYFNLSGDDGQFVFALQKPEPPREGKLSIRSNPTNSAIYLNDKYLGQSPIFDFSLKAGSYKLKATKEGYYPEEKSVEISEDQAQNVEFALKAKRGGLSIKAQPYGAEIYINEKKVGETSYQAELPTGVYRIKASKEGYYPAEKTVEFRADEARVVTLELSPKPARLAINVKPKGAEIYVDNKKVGETSYQSVIPAGNYQVKVSKEGYQTQKRKITLEPGQSREEDFALVKIEIPIGKLGRAKLYIGSGLAVSGVVSAIASYSFYEESQKLNEKFQKEEDEDTAQKLKDEGRQNELYSLILGGTSFACLVTSATFFYLHYSSSLQPASLFNRFSVVPFVTEDWQGIGFKVHVRF